MRVGVFPTNICSMPITIVDPLRGTVGPGATLNLQSTFIGPIQNGSTWVVELRGTDEQPGVPIRATQLATTNPQLVSVDHEDTSPISTARTYRQGESLQLHTQLLAPDTTVLDESTDTGWTFDATSNLWVHITRTQQSGASGGFQPADRTTLDNVFSGIQATFVRVADGTIGQTPIGQFFCSPPISLVAGHETIQISGTRSLLRPGNGRQVNAYGAHWSANTILDGYGRLPGVITQMEQRLLQVSVVADLPGIGALSIQSLNTDDQMGVITWNVCQPLVSIDVTVSAGNILNWQWIG